MGNEIQALGRCTKKRYTALSVRPFSPEKPELLLLGMWCGRNGLLYASCGLAQALALFVSVPVRTLTGNLSTGIATQ